MHKTLPPKEIQIEIKGCPYTIKFPTTAQFIDMQAMKARLSTGTYSILSESSNYNDGYAKILVEMVATYNTLLPELKEKIHIESIMGLSMIESRELLDPYVEIYVPWFTQWMDIITKVKEKGEPKPAA